MLFEHDGTVPTNGQFGVYDSSYDPNQWPDIGDYSISDWEFRVTITPSVSAQTPGGGGPAQATVKKKTRRRNDYRQGLTVEMNGVATVYEEEQIEMDMFMLDYLNASFNACNAVYNLAGIAFAGPPPDYSFVPKLYDTNDWAALKRMILNADPRRITDWHYFGHGSRKGLGLHQNDPSVSISLAEIQNSQLKTNPMSYAAMDGCHTAGGFWWWQGPDLLTALVGYKKAVDHDYAANHGLHPSFAWGWPDTKQINLGNGGELNYYHFYFVEDFYTKLCERDFSGFLDKTYADAIAFAKHPNGLGVEPSVINNPEGDDIYYVGVYDTYYDAR